MSGHTFVESAEAIVTRTDDPEELGRIKVICEAVAGDEEEISEWILPAPPAAGGGASWIVPPEPGDTVEIEYVTGSSLDPVYAASFNTNPRFRWKAGVNRDKEDVPEEFRGKYYGRRVGLRIGNGNFVAVDKKLGEASVTGSNRTRVGTLTGGQPAVLGYDLRLWVEKLTTGMMNAEESRSAYWQEIKVLLNTLLTAMNAQIIAAGGGDSTALITQLNAKIEEFELAHYEGIGDETYHDWFRRSYNDGSSFLSNSVSIGGYDGDHANVDHLIEPHEWGP